MHELDHRHLIVTAFATNLPTSVESGETWLRELVALVDMQILMDAQAIYCEDLGNEGVTGVVGLKTSHASFHSWHEADEPFVSFDLYSCRHFDHITVFDHLKKWGLIECDYTLMDRNPRRMKIIAQGTYKVE